MLERIKRWYIMNLWGRKQVMQAAEKGILTPQQAEAILSGEEI